MGSFIRTVTKSQSVRMKPRLAKMLRAKVEETISDSCLPIARSPHDPRSSVVNYDIHGKKDDRYNDNMITD